MGDGLEVLVSRYSVMRKVPWVLDKLPWAKLAGQREGTAL